MRAPVSFVVLLALVSGAPAQTISVTGVARSASLMEALWRNCNNVRADVARRYHAAFIEVGRKSYGAQTFDAELRRELPRRLREVRAAGARNWCRQQTAQQKRNGARDLFRD